MEEFSPEWFDACSIAWRSNKKRKGESWVYKKPRAQLKPRPLNSIAERVIQRRRNKK